MGDGGCTHHFLFFTLPSQLYVHYLFTQKCGLVGGISFSRKVGQLKCYNPQAECELSPSAGRGVTTSVRNIFYILLSARYMTFLLCSKSASLSAHTYIGSSDQGT